MTATDEPLAALLAELSAEFWTVAVWLRQALKGRVPPRPLLLSGEGAEEFAHFLALRLIRNGEDALPLPWSWVAPGGSRVPLDSLPRVAVVLVGMDDPDNSKLEAVAKRSALIVAGSVVPLLPGATSVLLDLPAARVADLRALADAGWPSAANR